MRVGRLFPGLRYLKGYRTRDWFNDILAGLTVSVLLVPQVMAYAQLAGLPPVYGLYASTIPLLLYGLMGSSPHLSVGPTALTSILVFAGVSVLAEPFSPEFIRLAITAGLLAGVLQLAFGLLRLGVLVNFLSRPVISGFTSAAAILIALSQTEALLGIPNGSGSLLHETLLHLYRSLDQISGLTAAVGVGAIVFLLSLKRWLPWFPAPLVLLILGTGLTAWLRLDLQGLAIVGDVPWGLPDFQWPVLNASVVRDLAPATITIAFISFIEAMAISKALESRHNYYQVRANQELIALGIAKIGGAFFQSVPSSGSLSRSALNEDSGAHSGIASLVGAAVVVLVLLVLTPLFYYLPQAVLGAVIFTTIIGLFQGAEMRKLLRHDRRDFAVLMVTFLLTLALGIQQGIAAGVVLSIILVISRNARPNIAILGRLPDTQHFRNIDRFDEAILEPDVLILRFDSQLYFANADYFREEIERCVSEKEGLRLLILDARSIHDLDSTGVYILTRLVDVLQGRGITFYVAGVIGPVRDLLFRTGLMERIGLANQFLSIDDALAYYRAKETENPDWDGAAVQTKHRK